MSEKHYGMLMVDLLNRDDQTENKVVLYPVTRIQVMDMSRAPTVAPRFTIIPDENSNWRIVDG
jgi:hypothetical protein